MAVIRRQPRVDLRIGPEEALIGTAFDGVSCDFRGGLGVEHIELYIQRQSQYTALCQPPRLSCNNAGLPCESTEGIQA